MSEDLSFEISDNLITKDNFAVVIKGIFKGGLSHDVILKDFQSYLEKVNFVDALILVEKDNLTELDDFSKLGVDYLNVITINAIQQEDKTEKYAINPDLEGKNKKKGFLGRFKK
ncbi:MAG: hypothetical protein GPJ54_14260 [Candidatus Heimdallarchaeota archaeon]|nr:hypothetical protein [Candidatus Heimdallarchaeota archaeon]